MSDGATLDSDSGTTLGERERAVLRFENRQWDRLGRKSDAIRSELGMSPTRYYQILNALLDSSAALAVDPVLIHRLVRRREARRLRRDDRAGEGREANRR